MFDGMHAREGLGALPLASVPSGILPVRRSTLLSTEYRLHAWVRHVARHLGVASPASCGEQSYAYDGLGLFTTTAGGAPCRPDLVDG